MKLVVGLGNPGKEYENTRHNLGFRVVDELARTLDIGHWTLDKKLKSAIVKFQLSNVNCLLVKPQTFMNNSGQAIRLLTDYYKIPSADLIVIHDDLDLPLGKIQLRSGGAAAGHHGVESVIEAVGSDQFIRVRIGIGPAVGASDKFVLESFAKKEQEQVEGVVSQAAEAVEFLLENGLEAAQNQFNR